ncbi:TonB-dependent receptor [Bacteroidia bacterium]|nr:TonB-dependent receptor [Bacteroidia bacterium]
MKKELNNKTLIVGIFLLNCTFAFSQNDDRLLDEVVVTATQTTHTLKNTPVLTRLISQKEIQQSGAVTVLEALENFVPGVSFTPNPMGDNIQIGGLNNKYILVLVDGERLVNERTENVNFSRLNTAHIKRIEIISGASSVLYGSNAIGAVINIITQDVTEPLQAAARTRFSTDNTWHSDVSLRLKRDRLASKTNFFAKNSDGNAVLNPYSNYAVAQALKYTFGDRSDAEIKGQYYRGETWLLDKFETRVDENYTLNGKWRYRFSAANELILAGNTDKYTGTERFKLHNDSTARANSSQYSTLRLTDTWDANEHLQIVGGVEFNWEKTFSYSQFGTAADRAAGNQNIFAQAEYRLDFIDILAGARYTRHSQFGSHFSPKISLMKSWKDFRFRGSVSNGYKVPTLKELYMNFLHPIDYVPFWVVGNAALKPETSWYESLSAEYLTNDINVSATIYTNQITNCIHTQRLWNATLQRSELHYDNIEKARISGVDIAAQWTVNQHIAIKGGYSFADATRRGTTNRSPLPGNSTHTATINATFSHKKQSVVISTRARSSFIAIYPPTPEAMLNPESTRVNGYWISNLVYNLQLSRGKWRGHLQTGINNVLDYKNQDALPGNNGRVYFVGMGVNFL